MFQRLSRWGNSNAACKEGMFVSFETPCGLIRFSPPQLNLFVFHETSRSVCHPLMTTSTTFTTFRCSLFSAAPSPCWHPIYAYSIRDCIIGSCHIYVLASPGDKSLARDIRRLYSTILRPRQNENDRNFRNRNKNWGVLLSREFITRLMVVVARKLTPRPLSRRKFEWKWNYNSANYQECMKRSRVYWAGGREVTFETTLINGRHVKGKFSSWKLPGD